MKTRNQWQEKFRKVKRGEKPSGVLNVTVPTTVHHEEIAIDGSVSTWTTNETKVRAIPVYSYEQTVSTRPLMPLPNHPALNYLDSAFYEQYS